MKKIIFLIFSFLLLCANQVYAASENLDAVNAYNSGIEYYQKGDIEKSVESFKKAISLDGNFYEAIYNLAQILASKGDTAEATKLYEKAIALNSDDFESMYGLGSLYYKKGYLAKAKSQLEKIPPESERYIKAQELLDNIQKKQDEIAQEEARRKAQMQALKDKEALAERTRIQTPPQPQIFSGIQSPAGVATDSHGNIYIASYSDNTVYKINQTGQKSVFVSPGILSGPVGLAVDKNDNLYVANYNKDNILKVLPFGAPYVFINVKKPYCVNAFGDFLYVTEQNTNTLLKFPL
jgi:tetratricopeptide (TPR) repeat protein